MSDLLFDLTHDAPVGKQQITNVSRVAYNFRLDNAELDDRKKKSGSSYWPTASIDNKSLYVLPRDLCFSFKRRASTRGGDGMPTVWSSFAGAGRSGKSMHEFIESLTFAGVAGGQGAVYDTTGNNPRFPEFAGVLGGLVTLVNNGPERISNGDLCYWDLPAPNTESNDMSMRNTERVTAIIRPYRPDKDKATPAAVKDAIRNPTSSDIKYPTQEAAIAFKRFANHATLLAFEALLSSGLVRFDAAALGTDASAARQRATNAAQWAQADRETHIVRVARALGCRNVRDPARNAGVTMPRDPNTSLQKYVSDLLIGDRLLIDSNQGYAPSGDKGDIYCNQLSAISDLLGGVAAAEHYIKRRIFLTALTPAAPGKEFDANLNHCTM